MIPDACAWFPGIPGARRCLTTFVEERTHEA